MTTEDSSKDKHGEQATENIRQQLDAFLQNRVELVLLMQEYANELDEVHKNVKITKVVTGSTGIVGLCDEIGSVFFRIIVWYSITLTITVFDSIQSEIMLRSSKKFL